MVKRERGISPPQQAPRRRKRGGRRRRKRQRNDVKPPPVPPSFACHICTKNHWTVVCPRLLQSPRDFPPLDRKKGCWKCAQWGHSSSQCPVKKYRCSDCGGLHDTRDCEFDHKSEEWHEFYDPISHHVFYTHSETQEVQWTPPTHRLDVVLWYCPNCKILLPNTVPECVKCRMPRPESQVSPPSSTSSGSSSCSNDEGSDEDEDEESVNSSGEEED